MLGLMVKSSRRLEWGQGTGTCTLSRPVPSRHLQYQ